MKLVLVLMSSCVAAPGRKKKQLNEVEEALKREETARKRKHMSEKRLEDEKAGTITRFERLGTYTLSLSPDGHYQPPLEKAIPPPEQTQCTRDGGRSHTGLADECGYT